mmetsp:Transcript_18094/g.27953  ORF Transcript_18094/g.27953 Transcript_18094/m.27953 type:complete len:451 (-) Transcript_18094:1723-3075(-)
MLGHRVAPLKCLANGHLDHLTCVQACDLHRKRFGPQSVAVTSPAGAVVLIALKLFTDPVRIRLAVAPFHVGNDAFKHPRDLINAATFVIAKRDFLVPGPAQKHLFHLLGQVFPFGVFVKFVMLGQGLDGLQEIGRFAFAPGGQGPVINLQILVRHDEALVKEKLVAQTIARGTRPKGRVERKQTWFNLRDRKTTDGTGEFFREGEAIRLLTFRRCRFEHSDTIRQIKRGAQAVCQPRLKPVTHHDPVHHHIDVMAEFLVQRWRIVQLIERAVHLDPLKALLAQFGELFAVLALAVADDRGQQIGARALFHRHDPVDHVLHLLRLNGLAGGRGVWRARPRIEQAHIVIDFGNRTHGGARVLGRRFLLNRNGGAEARNVIHIGLLHHIKELPRIGAQRFDIAPLPFGIDRIKGQRRLARPRKPSDHNQLVAGNIHINGFQVMLARAAHLDIL